MIHLLGSIGVNSDKFREHHRSGLDQVIRLVVLSLILLKKSVVNTLPDGSRVRVPSEDFIFLISLFF